MSYLVDTNVICELVKAKPNQNVVTWLKEKPEESLYLSVLTLGEINKGVGKIKDKKRQEKISLWLNYDLTTRFQNRILAIDAKVSMIWGDLLSTHTRSLPAIDSLIAATAIAHQLKIVARNLKDFDDTGVECLDPWQAVCPEL